jgi:phosphoserine phosphatase
MDPHCSYPCYRVHKQSSDSFIPRSKKIRLVFFDMDGVLIDAVSSWRYLHERFGTTNKLSLRLYLQGDIDYSEFMKRDISLWKQDGHLTKIETIKAILNEIPIIDGAKECIHFCRKHHVQTAIVSAGLDLLAVPVARNLCIEYVFANGVQTDADGRLNGRSILRVQLLHKEKNVVDLAQNLRIPLQQCAAVGNSCFDIPMFEACGLGIAFNPIDACVRESADHVVEGKDLRKLIPVLQSFV